MWGHAYGCGCTSCSHCSWSDASDPAYEFVGPTQPPPRWTSADTASMISALSTSAAGITQSVVDAQAAKRLAQMQAQAAAQQAQAAQFAPSMPATYTPASSSGTAVGLGIAAIAVAAALAFALTRK